MADPDKPADGDRPLWDLNRDEQRLLVITFVGGLASLVVGAVVIGGTIALARLPSPATLGLVFTAAGLGSVALGLFMFRLRWFQAMGYVPNYLRFFPALLVGYGGLGAIFGLLILIGLAAGIH